MRKVGFILHPGYSPMSLAVSTVFEIANLQAGEPVYDVRMLSEEGGPVRTSVGFEVMTVAFSGDPLDLLVVGGSMEDATTVALRRGSEEAPAESDGGLVRGGRR